MWIFSKVGFCSIVQKPGQSYLTVRSRVREDMENLRATYMPGLSVIMQEVARTTPTAPLSATSILLMDLPRWEMIFTTVISKMKWRLMTWRERICTAMFGVICAIQRNNTMRKNRQNGFLLEE